MIKFFRKIRYELLEKNKTGKYLKYAFGEIVLVVIGILIALQINNWNEERKIKQKETIILKELLASINSDLKSYEIFYDSRLERKANGIDSLFAYIFDKKEIKDSLFMDFYTNMSENILVRFDNGSFEGLKSSGIDIISNDSLKTAINNTYTVKLPIHKHFSNSLNDESKPEISKLEPKFLKLIPVLLKDGRKDLYFAPKVDDILNNQDFLWVLHIERQKYNQYISRVKEIKTILNKLKTEIEKELNK